MKRGILSAGIILGASLLVASTFNFTKSTVVLAQDSGTQTIEMTAKKYEFSPTPHIKKGQKVELKVTASDHDHGLAISEVSDGLAENTPAGLVFDSPRKCWKVKKGESITIDFTAVTAGTYTIKCCVDCGMGHRHMRGQIIVE